MSEQNKKKILEALKISLKLEEEGRKFFQEVASSIKSKLARQTFEFLAAEEDKHIERIQEFYNSIENPDAAETVVLDEGGAERRMEAFYDNLVDLKNEIKPESSDVEAYELALKFENGAESFYVKQLQETGDPHVQRFYHWLIREEAMHSKVIKSCLQFAQDPASWFEKRGE